MVQLQKKKEITEEAKGQDRIARQQGKRWNQVTALRFQTRKDIRHLRPPFGASVRRQLVEIRLTTLTTTTSLEPAKFLQRGCYCSCHTSKPRASSVIVNLWIQWRYMRLVPNNSCSPTGMSALTHPLQHISGKDHERRMKALSALEAEKLPISSSLMTSMA